MCFQILVINDFQWMYFLEKGVLNNLDLLGSAFDMQRLLWSCCSPMSCPRQILGSTAWEHFDWATAGCQAIFAMEPAGQFALAAPKKHIEQLIWGSWALWNERALQAPCCCVHTQWFDAAGKSQRQFAVCCVADWASSFYHLTAMVSLQSTVLQYSLSYWSRFLKVISTCSIYRPSAPAGSGCWRRPERGILMFSSSQRKCSWQSGRSEQWRGRCLAWWPKCRAWRSVGSGVTFTRECKLMQGNAMLPLCLHFFWMQCWAVWSWNPWGVYSRILYWHWVRVPAQRNQWGRLQV